MKLVKNYENFSTEYRLNENIFKNMWGAVINYFKRNFGPHAWLYYALYLDKNGQLPKKKVQIICPPGYLAGMEKGLKDIPTAKDIEAAMNAKFDPKNKDEYEDMDSEMETRMRASGDVDKAEEIEEVEDVEELEKEHENYTFEDDNHIWEFVTLKYPTEGKGLAEGEEIMRNINVKKLMDRIKRVYDMNALRAARHEGDKYSEESEHIRKKTHALFIWGAPGIGKTEILHQVARKLNILVQEWHLATIEPTDFRGIPKVENIIKGSVDPKDERTVSKLPAIFPTSDGNGKGGIMFFDEMNRAPGMVLGAALALALSGKHGEYKLPPRWIVIAAGNRPEDITTVQLEDDVILWNRFAHVNFTPSVDDWIDYSITKKDINPDLITFLHFHKQFYHRLDTEAKDRPNWTSARAWETASQEEYFKRKENWNNDLSYKEIQDTYTDQVGLDAALAFVEYLKLKQFYDENDVNDVYEIGANAKKLPKRQDQARAAIASIAFFKKDEKLKLQELKNILDFCLGLTNMEQRTPLMAFVKWVHPYIKTDEPYKTVYNEALKKWHMGLTT